MSEQNKKLWYILAGVGAVAAGLIAMKLMSGGEGEEDETVEEIPDITEEDLKTANIKDVERSGTGGMLESRYFLRLLQFVGERTRDHTKANRDKITKDRRAHYKAAEWKEYEECVKKGLDLEDQASQHVLNDIL